MEVARAFEVNGMFFPARNESCVVSTEVHTGVQARRPLQRLEMRASVAEVERAFEVNPNVLHRWRREFREGPDARCGRAEDHHAHPIEPALRGEG